MFTDRYVKKWAGLPSSATNEIIHSRSGMHIKSISELYMEVHCVSHARTRLEGDANVNRVIDCSVSREENFTRKKCTTTEAEAEFLRAVNMYTVQGEIPTYSGYDNRDRDRRNFNIQIKDQIKTSLTV